MKKSKNIILFVTIGLVFSLLSCKELKYATYDVIPFPSKIVKEEGKPFKLTSKTKIVYPAGNEKMRKNADFLADYLHSLLGIKLSTTTEQVKKNAIVLSLNLKNSNSEAYQLIITSNKISIKGASESGVFYGIQTLRKSTPIGKINVAYAPTVINDQPRFEYRGMMLDVARHFQPVEFIKKYIDLLALHNVNIFHWHLTEDQGWRIEIKSYPKLTEIGSTRKQTVLGRNNSGKFDGKPHSGFYTQEEIKEIVKYAADRYITIIPEIDLPGHMLSALASYPELGCTGGPYEVGTKWGVFEDVLCPGKEKTFEFLEGVLTEVMSLFPAKYIHIGGDECPKTRWEKCPDCQARIKEEGLVDKKGQTAEHFLQSYVTTRIEKFLNAHGRSIIGWDELLEGKLAPNATVMSWRGMIGGVRAARMKHNVVMSPTTFAYFDFYQVKDKKKAPLAIGGYLPLKKVYRFEPASKMLTNEQKKYILGAQANLWTEYIATPEYAEYMTLPRLAAMCEVQWTEASKKNYDAFLIRLPQLLKLYEKLGYNYYGKDKKDSDKTY